MKKILVGFMLIFTFTSCSVEVKLIGRVNMISNRNIDSKLSYEPISTYSGGSKSELKKTKAESVENAISQTIRKIPGGEYLMNAKIYMVNGKYIAIEGDVWGIKNNLSYRGFKVGDKVTWKVFGVFKSGVIKSLKDDKTCLIDAENGNVVEKKYDDISKGE